MGFFEDHGVEAVAGEEAGLLVEIGGLVVGLGYGQGDCAEAGVQEVAHAVFQERFAEAVAATGGRDTELGDVGDVVGDAGAEDHGDEGAGAGVAEDPGLVRLEDAAAGEADDVVEEAEGAVEGAVLIVDEGVDVAGVGLVDEFGCGLVVEG